jgi:hypothetical protein
VSLTANFKMAPTAMRKMLTPTVMAVDPSVAGVTAQPLPVDLSGNPSDDLDGGTV